MLAIGGSDCSGGAGVQADLATVLANGGAARTVVTAVTAQSSRGVHASYPMPAAVVAEQIAAAYIDEAPQAVKIGMLATAEVVVAVTDALRRHRASRIVLDPVLRSSSGAALLDDAGADALRTSLLPLVDVVTPNAAEAAVLAGCEVRSRADAAEAGRRMLALGPRAVLITGGHLERDRATDVLVTASGVQSFVGQWQPDRDVHGTGCAYASAVATYLAAGQDLPRAVELAKRYLESLIATAVRVGDGALMPDHLAAQMEMER